MVTSKHFVVLLGTAGLRQDCDDHTKCSWCQTRHSWQKDQHNK